MADLFVTFPKHKKNRKRITPTIEYYRKNKRKELAYLIGRIKPSKAKAGDKCYVGFDNKVQCYFIYEKTEFVFKNETKTWEDWDGKAGTFLFFCKDSYVELNEPKPKYKQGFMGFRYYKGEKKRRNITIK